MPDSGKQGPPSLVPEAVLERLAALMGECRENRFDVVDDTGMRGVDHHLANTVSAILQSTAATMLDIQREYEAAREAAPEDDTQEVGPAEIADLAFIGRCEMLSLLEALQGAVAQAQVWKVLSHADTALSRVERAVVALSNAVRRQAGLPVGPDTVHPVEEALEIRHHYALFRRTLQRVGKPGGADLEQAMEQIRGHIEALRQLPTYTRMRIDDRRQIRALQKRLDACLKSGSTVSEEERLALWEDVLTSSELFMEVNNRQELKEHDRRLIRQVYRELFVESSQGHSGVLERLAPLLGRDHELDQLLLAPAPPDPSATRKPIERLRRALAAADSGEFPSA